MIRKLTFVSALLLIANIAGARPPNEAEFTAAGGLGEQIGAWVAKQNIPDRSVAVFSVITAEPFDQDYAAIVEANVLKKLNQSGFEHATTCSECRSPQINIEGEMLVIRKGTPDAETIKKVGERQQVGAFLTIDIYRSNLYVLAQASLYRNGTAELIGTEKFSEAAVSFENTDIMLLLTVGAGKPQGVTESNYSLAGNLMLVEELGFGKGGLSLGMVLPTSAGSVIYVAPTLVLGSRIGSTGMSYAVTGAAGFGLNAGIKGITARTSLEFLLGSWTVFGFDYLYFSGSTAATGESLTGYYGIHLGISFGR